MTVPVRPCLPEDLAQVAVIFRQAFAESIDALVPRGSPAPEVFQDIFALLYRAMPGDFYVIDGRQGVEGYIIAPSTGMNRLWRHAVFSGTLLGWAGKWLLGRYRVPIWAIPGIVRNKLLFVTTEKAHSPSGSYGRILSIAVTQSARGKGLGKLLVEHGLKSLKTKGLDYVKLEVRPDNIPAVKAYTSLGFIQMGKTRDVQGEWLVMLKDLRN